MRMTTQWIFYLLHKFGKSEITRKLQPTDISKPGYLSELTPKCFLTNKFDRGPKILIYLLLIIISKFNDAGMFVIKKLCLDIDKIIWNSILGKLRTHSNLKVILMEDPITNIFSKKIKQHWGNRKEVSILWQQTCASWDWIPLTHTLL